MRQKKGGKHTGYRKKAFRLEIRRGDFGDGYIVRYNGGERPDRATEDAIVNAIGAASLNVVLRSVKILVEQKPPAPSPEVEGPGAAPPP